MNLRVNKPYLLLFLTGYNENCNAYQDMSHTLKKLTKKDKENILMLLL